MTDPDQGGPKTSGSGGSGCATLFFLLADLRKISFFFEMEFLKAFLVEVTGHILKFCLVFYRSAKF
jgi:hypothetical protein